MARSSYVYLCMSADGEPLAAFTVKHDMQAWVAETDDELVFEVLRMADNPSSYPGDRPAVAQLPLDQWAPEARKKKG